MVPAGVILVWGGTNASIPSGWERETSLDDRFPKGTEDSTNPNVERGGNTHTHTSPSHTHTMASHSHSGSTTEDGDFETHGGGNPDVARNAHHHDFNISGLSGGSLSDSITYQSGNSIPPYCGVIFIKPTGVGASLSDDIAGFYADTTIPSQWVVCDGNNSTLNLNGKFIRGASAGANAGTTGGSTSHTHSVSHTHSSSGHTHSGTTGLDSDYGNRTRSTDGSGGGANPRHTHTITLASNSDTGTAYSGSVNGSGTEPLYKKLLAIKNNSGHSSQPRGIIGLWLDDLDSIPFGWLLCDGTRNTPDMREYHLKATTSTGEIEDTGGSNTHTHSASNSHKHNATSSHSHTGSTNYMSINYPTTADNDGVSKPHSHTVAGCSSTTATYGYATISANSSNNEPEYTTVAFIQYRFRKGMAQII